MKKLLFLLLSFLFVYAKPTISVSIEPQAFLVQKIAKDSVNINVIIPKNIDEHSFEFKPSNIKTLEQSDIYFTIDLEFERVFLDKFKDNFKNLLIVDMQENISLMSSKHERHEHKAHSDHKDHENLDIHTWLDPILLKIQATNISKALSNKYPQNAKMYEENLNSLVKELDELNSKIKTLLTGIKSNKFIVYHPSWGYFAKRYNLEQIPVEIEGKEPKPRDLQRLINIAKNENIKIIFMQPGFSQNAAQNIAKECGAKILYINHLSYDLEKELLSLATHLANSLKE
ncbi:MULTISPECIES: metal ABC transporter solute-binding protein, Zn/Mn family [unclassified Campylobacter]|uniref:metal ABC transporter solute-binding protein, Zn/Mn family n=1 Tax=unclassified Campylobacter TaxID=2593542 RepID=UPI001237B1AF|nr:MULTISPECIES: zinc ABC transporter substrate-binding protein [unclassified Campylobacter]KAA6227255.1 cation ABC transporter substrate-binding protein [Campylobacter sp. LR286c]KAA6227872.1 cation ABC transporter substrate-binding protein [Campylobacter sp. LR185c]KAA6228280.1 cation ABC transporter substrate-binding protein [Campylobacter sp. LR196d]KAA6229280.1 cation ABC transporter substrate-binding protein [Campylobacter sp. LR291e]KAA6231086.1 cation ABC transporter substrate-binding 